MEALKVIFTRDDSQRQFFAQHNFAILEQCCNYSKQCRNNVETLCCVKNHRCESSRVTSPLRSGQNARLRSGTIMKDLPMGRTHESHY